MEQANKPRKFWPLIPVCGILIYAILYIAAASLYPGGSQADKNSTGFSWVNNYWCNLTDINAINGQPNPARPYALCGMLVLCSSLAFFWFLFPLYANIGKAGRLVIQISGVAAMFVADFLFTSLHDAVINVSGALGVVALTGTLICLYKNKWWLLFYFGIFNLFLVGLNNYIYHGKSLFYILPLVQKISFLSFLVWFCCICVKIYRCQNELKQLWHREH